MEIKRIIYLIILLVVICPISANAMDISIHMVNKTDLSTNGHYYDTSINELYDGEGDHVFCMDHGKSAYSGSYYRSGTIWEGPACGFALYANQASGTASLHNLIRYVQYYSDSTFACSKYKYKSGSCDNNSKNAIDDTNSSLILNQTNTKFEIENSYYVTVVQVTSAGSATEYIPTLVNAPSDTLITTARDGVTTVAGTKITANQLYVKVPLATATDELSFDLSVNASYSTTCAYEIPGIAVFIPNASLSVYQRLSYPVWKDGEVTKDFTKTANINLTIESLTGTIKITKVDVASGMALAGITFRLFDTNGESATYADGTEIGELITDRNGEITINNLKYGTYVLRETSNNPYFLKLEEDLNIVLNSVEEEVTVTNVPIILKISKQDLDTHMEVIGATIVIKNADGNEIIDPYVSTGEPIEFYVTPGEYSLEETVAPTGYEKLKTSYRFKVNNDGIIELIDNETKYLGLEDGILILYNSVEKVVVPDTLSVINYILLSIGAISLLTGVVIIYITKKRLNKNTK